MPSPGANLGTSRTSWEAPRFLSTNCTAMTHLASRRWEKEMLVSPRYFLGMESGSRHRSLMPGMETSLEVQGQISAWDSQETNAIISNSKKERAVSCLPCPSPCQPCSVHVQGCSGWGKSEGKACGKRWSGPRSPPHLITHMSHASSSSERREFRSSAPAHNSGGLQWTVGLFQRRHLLPQSHPCLLIGSPEHYRL